MEARTHATLQYKPRKSPARTNTRQLRAHSNGDVGNNNNKLVNYYYCCCCCSIIILSTDRNVATTTTTKKKKTRPASDDWTDRTSAVPETFGHRTRTDHSDRMVGWFVNNDDDDDDKAGAREWRVRRVCVSRDKWVENWRRETRSSPSEKPFENPSAAAAASTRTCKLRLPESARLPATSSTAADKRGPFRDDARRHFRTGLGPVRTRIQKTLIMLS